MCVASLSQPTIRHILPGRVRIVLPDGITLVPDVLARRLYTLPGVRQARVNAFTHTALIHYDPDMLAPDDLLAALRKMIVVGPAATQGAGKCNAREAGTDGASLMAPGLAIKHCLHLVQSETRSTKELPRWHVTLGTC
jgi:hypothetical protein